MVKILAQILNEISNLYVDRLNIKQSEFALKKDLPIKALF